MSEASHTDEVPTDDWSVPKLIGIAALVLGAFFAVIYTVSPFDGVGMPPPHAVK
jgi:hypothetical protein